MGSKAKRIKSGCPCCKRDAHEIWWKDNHGQVELLETHCNKCGWAISGEGELRNPGKLPEGRIHGGKER